MAYDCANVLLAGLRHNAQKVEMSASEEVVAAVLHKADGDLNYRAATISRENICID